LLPQQLPEQALGGRLVAPALDEDVEHDPVLIHGTPEVMQPARDADGNLVHVPFVARPRPSTARPVRETPAELAAPASNALVRDDHTPLGQDRLDVARAEAEHVVEPDGLADRFGRKAMTAVRVG